MVVMYVEYSYTRNNVILLSTEYSYTPLVPRGFHDRRENIAASKKESSFEVCSFGILHSEGKFSFR